MAIPCTKFTDYLIRKSEHLEDDIIKSMHPIDTWVGHVSTGRFPAHSGVEQTFDRFENVFPDLTGTWEDVTGASCVGTPCDPSVSKIGFGFTRDSFRLQRKSYGTDLFCFDQILSADKAKSQFAHILVTLRRASTIISSNRLRNEALRIAGKKWVLRENTMKPVTMTWDSTMTLLTVSALPTSKVTGAHLQRRVQPQIRQGALGAELNKSKAPMLEYVTSMDEIWGMSQGNPALISHWQFQDFGEAAAQFYKYGWTGKVGNFGLRDDTFQLRFNLKTLNGNGSAVLQLVFPYENVAATQGIKEEVNDAYDNAPYKIDFIWHRDAMKSLVRDTSTINPEMPFASRDFAGKWRWAMHDLTCGLDVNGNPIAVNNEWGNKGKFLAQFSLATKAEHPELAEAMLALREPAVIVDAAVSATDPGYPVQNYSSANEPCPTVDVVLNFTPVAKDDGTYFVPSNTILCNGIPIIHEELTGSKSLAALVVELNTKLAPMGIWAVAGSEVTLTGASCTYVNIPWTVT